jgi:hypothetical protein
LRGYDTLLIEADPQAEATARLIDPERVRPSVSDLLFTPDLRRGPRFGLEDVLVPQRSRDGAPPRRASAILFNSYGGWKRGGF